MISRNTILAAAIFLFNLNSVESQNVGINNTSPDQSLDVIGTVQIERSSSSTNPQLDLKNEGNGYSRLKFSGDEAISDNYWIFSGRTFQANDPSSRFNLYYSGDTVTGDLLTVRGTGKIGVNVTNPSDRFHINAKSGENAFRVQINNQTKLRVLSNGGISVGVNNPAAVPINGMYISGNVGMGIQNPSEKLSVNGNIETTGEILPDGLSGESGQMLISNGNGGMLWSYPCDFNSYIGFGYTGMADFWVVPVGVTRIQVEAWGGGGGGARGGGGGAGAYVSALIEVAEGETFSMGVGNGGDGVINGQAISASGGTTTDVIGSGVAIAAGGGSGATITNWGSGGTTLVNPATTRNITRNGIDGMPIEEIPVYSGYTKIDFGKGGESPFGGQGGKGEVHNGTGIGTVFNEGSNGVRPGGGGGGGDQFGNDGAPGYVIIRWNQ